MSIIELYNNIARGGEIEFTYANKNYSITHSKKGIHVMEFYNYSTEKIYQNSTDIGEYCVDGEKLEDLFDKAEITFSCF